MASDTLWGWHVVESDGQTHIVPANDTHLHLWHKCPCCPQPDDETGAFLHNSFDGREDFESGARKVS